MYAELRCKAIIKSKSPVVVVVVVVVVAVAVAAPFVLVSVSYGCVGCWFISCSSSCGCCCSCSIADIECPNQFVKPFAVTSVVLQALVSLFILRLRKHCFALKIHKYP